MSSIAALENELAEAIDNVKTCESALSMDADDAEAATMLEICKEEVQQIKARIADAKAEQNAAPPPPTSTTDTPPPPPPALGSAPPPPPADEQQRAVFSTGDTVMAKFSEDKQWYQASIIGKTGSSSDPVYTVKFIGYGNKETKRKFEVRAVENKKRKAEGPPITQTAPAPVSPKASQDRAVISAAPAVDTSLVQKREPSKVSDGPMRMLPEPKKLKGSKALDKAKSSWMDWQKSGPKKTGFGGVKNINKSSQFRTSDLPNAKVGFTGSGKPMQKDQARKKWKYDQTDKDDQDERNERGARSPPLRAGSYNKDLGE